MRSRVIQYYCSAECLNEHYLLIIIIIMKKSNQKRVQASGWRRSTCILRNWARQWTSVARIGQHRLRTHGRCAHYYCCCYIPFIRVHNKEDKKTARESARSNAFNTTMPENRMRVRAMVDWAGMRVLFFCCCRLCSCMFLVRFISFFFGPWSTLFCCFIE